MSVDSEYLLVNKIIPFSNVDGDGNHYVIFLQGCNLNCIYCHNPETINICNDCGDCVAACQSGALVIKKSKVIYNRDFCINCDRCITSCQKNSSPKTEKMSVLKLCNDIKMKSKFIRGVVFSGGECSLQSESISKVFYYMKKNLPNLERIVDTNGYVDFSQMHNFVESFSGAYLDIKAFDEMEHIAITGKSNKTVLKNLKFLLSLNKLYEVRTLICPELFNYETTVKEVLKILEGHSVKYSITPYRPIGVKNGKNIAIPDDLLMERLRGLYP